jgi:2-polyprenyl-6-hydroxyphenyl methylase/3-demethylubiquinone-9 3-methyltransferase
MQETDKCDICGCDELLNYSMGKDIIRFEQLTPDNFKVTDKDYGRCVETVKCGDCGLVQPKYVLDSRDIVKLYANVEDESYLATSDIRGSSNYQQVIRMINKSAKNRGSLLEIGAGSGGLLEALKHRFDRIHGVEPCKKYCRFAKERYGLALENIGYEDVSEKCKYDVILALDVIEHVVSVRHFADKVFQLLADDGIAIISTPTKNSLAVRLLGKRWWHIRPPHLYYLDNRSFRVLMDTAGFQIIAKEFFYWTFPVNYLVDCFQKLLFKKSYISLNKLTFCIKLNTFDSWLYVIRKR